MNHQPASSHVLTVACGWLAWITLAAADLTQPVVGPNLVFEEQDGLVAVEAEHFHQQTLSETRAWYLTSSGHTPDITPDGDPPHLEGASGGAYLECLPDTRRTHADPLIHGENFSNQPGRLALLHYRIHFTTPGRYYVWARAYSTGTEDNGLHVGLNGQWPESGQRMQWCDGKDSWRWESKQRTEEEHCGVPHAIYLDIPTAGTHEILFSMREDGFEFDKFLLTTDRDFPRPEDAGPPSRFGQAGLSSTTIAAVDAAPAKDTQPPNGPARKPFPAHWGEPPQIQTMDYRPLPGGYGFGSSTLASWIEWNLTVDEAKAKGLVLEAKDFPIESTGYYLDQGKWLAINPDQRKEAQTQLPFPFPSGRYDVILLAVGEDDGRSTYEVSINNRVIGEFICPLSERMYEEGPRFSKRWNEIEINSGDLITVRSQIGSNNDQEFSRARWARLIFAAADDATKAAVATLEPIAKPSAMSEGSVVVQPRQPDGDGSVLISGELNQWHKVTLTLDGPYAHERDRQPNPFTDYNFTVTFRHESGLPAYTVPGYFAADGDAANTSADAGTHWRAHLSPDLPGKWTYTISFIAGEHAALGSIANPTLLPYSGKTGSFMIEPTDRQGRDFRAKGRLQYVGQHHLRFAGTGEYFLKAGPDAPETLLAYADFDGTEPGRKQAARPGEAAPTQALKTWEPHLQDWRPGDPTWKDGKGKGLIGALNYLAAKGVNAFSFLPYNAGGDGDNVWPFVARDQKLHYDCSKLDQWGIVFDHATAQGLYLHFKLQETEIDDDRLGSRSEPGLVPESLDGGRLGPERKLYCREIIARYAHNLALNWNIGEENTQSTEEITDMAKYLHDTDPYQHHIVIHTYPNQQDQVYTPLLGNNSLLTGASLQNSWSQAHQRTLKWVRESARAGKPWVVANDEQNPADMGVPPDPGYAGHSGEAVQGGKPYTLHDIRKLTLWGTLMAGGAGVEYYFGYKLPANDLLCEDWRSRDRSWDYCAIALEFFSEHQVPFWEMSNANALIGNPQNNNSKYCLAKPGEVYLVYLPNGGTSDIDLSEPSGGFTVKWFNPRESGPLRDGSVRSVNAGGSVSLGEPPADPQEDWLIVLRK